MVAENENLYFIVKKKDDAPLQHINGFNKNIITSTVDGEVFESLKNKLNEFDAIVLHNLISPYKLKILEGASSNIHFHWMSWGGDLYIHPKLKSKIYHHSSKKIIAKRQNANGIIGEFMERFFPYLWDSLYLKKRKIIGHHQYHSLIQKITSISTVLPNEMPLINRYYGKKMRYLPYKYIMFEHCSKDNDICDGNNFLIGNSATASNNHLEAFNYLNGIEKNICKIIVPLSYGEPGYAEVVIKRGNMMFGNKFKPLTDFIPLKDYSQMMKSCGNVVMNHYRQQAMGNILVALWKGARVYLNRKNLAWQFFEEHNIRVFEVSDIKNYASLPNHQTLANHNRPILEKLYGAKQVLKETKELVDYLTKTKSHETSM